MKHADLQRATVEQLVDDFERLALKQHEAIEAGNIATVNKLLRRMWAVEEVLKSREGDQRKALAVFFKHPNIQVRVSAANATVAVLPTEAIALLREIQASHLSPQSADAGITLRGIDSGEYKPT